jgi:hypothetical protein
MRSNYAFKPTAEQALRSTQPCVPRRLNAALAVSAGLLAPCGQHYGVLQLATDELGVELWV